MKHALSVALLATSVLAFAPTPAQADDISLRICEYVAVNDKTRLRKFLKTNNLKIRSVFDDLSCNGKNLLLFAAESSALDTGEFLISQLPVQTVQDNLDKVKAASAHLGVHAEKRIAQ